MQFSEPHSISEVADVVRVGGREGTPPGLLVEIPHGATAAGDYHAIARRMASALPNDLIEFFFVNTDTGAPELGLAIAERFSAFAPERGAVVVRCRIPRTFVDVNRRLDATLAEYKAGGVGPGLMPWVVEPDDIALCTERYEVYTALVRGLRDALPADGAMLLMHSYAPRTVGVEVDEDIVKQLRAAYAPELVETWPQRPAMDVISRAPDGVEHAPAEVVTALADALHARGLELGRSATYGLHPTTMGWEHALARPGRVVCLEARRDLFVERFQPFVEAKIDPARVAALLEPVWEGLSRWWV